MIHTSSRALAHSFLPRTRTVIPALQWNSVAACTSMTERYVHLRPGSWIFGDEYGTHDDEF